MIKTYREWLDITKYKTSVDQVPDILESWKQDTLIRIEDEIVLKDQITDLKLLLETIGDYIAEILEYDDTPSWMRESLQEIKEMMK